MFWVSGAGSSLGRDCIFFFISSSTMLNAYLVRICYDHWMTISGNPSWWTYTSSLLVLFLEGYGTWMKGQGLMVVVGSSRIFYNLVGYSRWGYWRVLLSLLKELVSGFLSWTWEWPPNHHKLGSIWLPTLPCQLGPPPCIGFWKRCLLLNSHLATQSQTPSHLSPQSSASSPRQESINLLCPPPAFLLEWG